MEVSDGKGKLTQAYFCDTYHLSRTEFSRWLSRRGRGIADGTYTDLTIRERLKEAIAKLEAKKAARDAARATGRVLTAKPNGSLTQPHKVLSN
jgi:hypothetical protein